MRSPGSAVAFFLVSRLIIWSTAVVVLLVAPERVDPEKVRFGTVVVGLPGAITNVWLRWDAVWYQQIAVSGYQWPSGSPAFFPILPLLMAPVGRVLGDEFVLAGVLVSLTAGSVAVAALHRLGRDLLDDASAARAVMFLCVFPTALFLGAPYTESLFLSLAVGTFLLAERGHLGFAAVATGLALLTRPQGPALLFALIVLIWKGRGVRGLPLLAIPLAIFAIYPLVLWVWIGQPFAFLEAQERWGQSLSVLGPLGGVVQAVQDANPFDLVILAVFVPLGVLAWRMLGAAYGVYALSSLAIPLSALPAEDDIYSSLPRYAIVAFPCFLVLGSLGRRRAFRVAVLSISATWLAVNIVLWSLWAWVA